MGVVWSLKNKSEAKLWWNLNWYSPAFDYHILSRYAPHDHQTNKDQTPTLQITKIHSPFVVGFCNAANFCNRKFFSSANCSSMLNLWFKVFYPVDRSGIFGGRPWVYLCFWWGCIPLVRSSVDWRRKAGISQYPRMTSVPWIREMPRIGYFLIDRGGGSSLTWGYLLILSIDA